MDAALQQARAALLAGESPVGAVLLRDGKMLAAANAVIAELDPSAHAELQVIRLAAREWRQLHLNNACLYVTVEPCRMCRAACYYAGIREIVFGASLADMQAITRAELAASAESDDGLSLRGGCRAQDCRDLLQAWAARRPV